MFEDDDTGEQEALPVAPVRPQAAAETPPAKPEKRMTPAQWSEKLGHVRKADPRIPQSVTHADWQHAAADELYGWTRHAYHYQSDPFLITQDEYQNALGAAVRYPCCRPYEPAIPPSQANRFAGFRPRAARG